MGSDLVECQEENCNNKWKWWKWAILIVIVVLIAYLLYSYFSWSKDKKNADTKTTDTKTAVNAKQPVIVKEEQPAIVVVSSPVKLSSSTTTIRADGAPNCPTSSDGDRPVYDDHRERRRDYGNRRDTGDVGERHHGYRQRGRDHEVNRDAIRVASPFFGKGPANGLFNTLYN